MNKQIFAVVAGALLCAACAHAVPFTPGPHLTLVPATSLPPPADIDPNSSERPYRVGAFDKLGIAVFGMPELTQTVQVDASGRIAVPLVGSLDVRGSTPEQISRQITAQLRGHYVRDPQVTVNVEETVSQMVTVDGEVREPGSYPVVGRMTLMRAVAAARGTTEFARLQDVVVFRTVGDHDMAALYNLQAIRHGMYPDPEIFSNDVIVVGDSPARRMFRDFLQLTPLLSTPLIALLNRV